MRLPEPPIVYCISEGHANPRNFREVKVSILARAGVASRCGVNLFQIREKSLTADLLFDLTEAVVKTVGREVMVLVNDRADVAIAAGAAGVHLPANRLPVDVLRREAGPELMIGISTHTMDEAISARDNGADLIVFGPVFKSPGKGNGVGLDELRNVCVAAAPMAVLALGGIDGRRVDEVLAAGASGFASIRYLNEILERKARK